MISGPWFSEVRNYKLFSKHIISCIWYTNPAADANIMWICNSVRLKPVKTTDLMVTKWSLLLQLARFDCCFTLSSFTYLLNMLLFFFDRWSKFCLIFNIWWQGCFTSFFLLCTCHYTTGCRVNSWQGSSASCTTDWLFCYPIVFWGTYLILIHTFRSGEYRFNVRIIKLWKALLLLYSGCIIW